MSIFEIDPDIRRAKTLTSEFYTDEKWFVESKEKIFARSWQLIETDGCQRNLVPFTLLPGFLDEPLLLSREHGREICLSNVCTHRGKTLVERACDAKLIRCGYHGRRFSLDGSFLSMPEFERAENFPTDADDLCKIPLARWGQFLFAALEPAAAFEVHLGDAAQAVDIAGFAGAGLASSKNYTVNAHWALYCENYLEGFHIPFVHNSLNEIVDFGTYATDIYRYSSLQTGYDSSGRVAGRYLFLFPNLMFNFYPWGISVNVVKPVNSGKTEVTFLTYISDDAKTETGAGADLDRVEMEDEAVVESVQKGIRSRFYSRGRYSPTREQGTHHFHRLIAEFMR